MYLRGWFARICVKVVLGKKQVPKINVLGNVLCLECEGLHSICFQYGKYGYKFENCSEGLKLQETVTMVEQN